MFYLLIFLLDNAAVTRPYDSHVSPSIQGITYRQGAVTSFASEEAQVSLPSPTLRKKRGHPLQWLCQRKAAPSGRLPILWLNGGLEMGFRCLSTWMTGQTIEAMPRSCYKFACLLAGARRRVKLSETLTVCGCRTQRHRYRQYAEGLFAAYSQSAFACLPRVPLTQTVVPP